MSKRIYLAGPMSGQPYFNFPAFFAYEEALKAQGHYVWSPARNDIARYGEFYKQCPNGSREELDKLDVHPTYRAVLKDDLNMILDGGIDTIALMPGWEKSKGARVEFALAECLGLEVIKLEELK